VEKTDEPEKYVLKFVFM